MTVNHKVTRMVLGMRWVVSDITYDDVPMAQVFETFVKSPIMDENSLSIAVARLKMNYGVDENCRRLVDHSPIWALVQTAVYADAQYRVAFARSALGFQSSLQPSSGLTW